ncbi:MAG: hypothetical protein L0H29_02950 [Sinobacteraceae bacterium]|nr:hypothetical protein [Nevskiaceae bacterium]
MSRENASPNAAVVDLCHDVSAEQCSPERRMALCGALAHHLRYPLVTDTLLMLANPEVESSAEVRQCASRILGSRRSPAVMELLNLFRLRSASGTLSLQPVRPGMLPARSRT